MVTIDGTDISGATIDGTDVQEITVDGDVVWTSVPSSAIYYWEEREYLTAGDMINYGSLSDLASILGNHNAFSISFTARMDTEDGNFMFEGVQDGNSFDDHNFQAAMRPAYAGDTNSQVGFGLGNDGDNRNIMSIDEGSHDDKTFRHYIICVGNDDYGNPGSWDAYVDGNSASTDVRYDESTPSFGSDWEFATHVVDKVSSSAEMDIEELMIHDKKLSSSEAQDIYEFST